MKLVRSPFRSRIFIIFTAFNILYGHSACGRTIETNTSDHSILFVEPIRLGQSIKPTHRPNAPHMQTPAFPRVATFNIAQRGKLQLFGSVDTGVYWSSTLRMVPILQILKSKKGALNTVAEEFSEIATSTTVSTEEKNNVMYQKALENEQKIRDIGIAVEGVQTVASATFNPGVSRAELKNNPDKFIKGPLYDIESSQTYTTRLENAFKKLFSLKPEIAFTQEIELGSDQEAFNKVVKKYPHYGFIEPTSLNRAITDTAVVTFYDTARYEAVTKESDIRNSIYTIFANLFDISNDVKLTVSTLQDKETGKLIFAVNIHAPYGPSNQFEESYEIIKELIQAVPNMIVGGDFNLRHDKEDWLQEHFAHNKRIIAAFALTPETVDIGNPTFDALFISMGSSVRDYKKIVKELEERSKKIATKRRPQK